MYTFSEFLQISCMSVSLIIGLLTNSWLTSLLELDKYKDNSRSVWEIFMKFFGDIPGMFLHQFKIVLIILLVSQSVSWLTHLLKLGHYRDISCPIWYFSEKFSRHSWDVFTLALNTFQFLVCLLVGLLPYLNKANIGISPVRDEIFSEIV